MYHIYDTNTCIYALVLDDHEKRLTNIYSRVASVYHIERCRRCFLEDAIRFAGVYDDANTHVDAYSCARKYERRLRIESNVSALIKR